MANPHNTPTYFKYFRPSSLIQGLLRKSIESSEGVKQGDPLASLLFTNAIQPIYDEIVLRTGLQAGALQDDLTLIGKPDALINAVPIIKELAAQRSLEMQPTKSQFIHFHHKLSQSNIDALNSLNIPIKQSSAKVLGCPIAFSSNDLFREVRESIKPVMEQINRCSDDTTVSTQTAIAILRSCFVPKMDYLMRCLGNQGFVSRTLASPHSDRYSLNYSDEDSNNATWFERHLIHFLLKRLDIDPHVWLADRDNTGPGSTLELIRLPVKFGGLGLCRTSDRINFCYLASIATAMRTPCHLNAISDLCNQALRLPSHRAPHHANNTPTILQNISPLFALLDESIDIAQTLSGNKLDSAMPKNCIEFARTFLFSNGTTTSPKGSSTLLAEILPNHQRSELRITL